MRKTVFVVVIIIIVAIGGFFYSNFLEKKPISKSEVVMIKPAVNDYPNMKLIMADGSMREARELTTKSIFIIYFPDCDHCQREAKDISSHLQWFENYQLYFIATAPFKDIDQFAKDYQLTNHTNINFVRTTMPEVLNNFGAIPTPSVYIYSSEKRLVKAFIGETKVEEIIKYL